MDANKPNIYLFGEVLVDHFNDDTHVLGGAPFNVAWHLQAFGAEPKLISRIGKDDIGKSILTKMQSWGMSTDFIQMDNTHPTGRVEINIQNGDASYDIKYPVAYDFIEPLEAEIDANNALLYSGTLAIREPTSYSTLTSIKSRYGAKLKSFIDINIRKPWWHKERTINDIRYSDYLKINEDELNEICPSGDSNTLSGWKDQALELKKQHHIVNLLVTRGSNGAYFFDKNNDLYDSGKPPECNEIIDTVGAGDAFSAVLLLGIINQWEWQNCMLRAQEFASYIVTQQGATSENHAIYDDFKSLWGIS